MSKFMRKVMAFVLGAIFGITAIAGGVVGGAYWAYKNVKPVELAVKDKPASGTLGDLETASVENLLDLLADAMANPDEYTVKRIEKEYGFNVEEFLKKVGVITEDPRNVDMEALRDVSLFSVLGGMDNLLKSVKLRALYVFVPKLTGKSLESALSLEAREKLGDYTLYELIKDQNGDGEIGLVSALKNLKLGAMLPSLFDAEYDEVAHEYKYSLKNPDKFPILDLFGDIYVGTAVDIARGSDLFTELMEGGLKSISEKKVADVLTMLAASGSADARKNMEEKARAFGSATIADLFEKKDGKYVFSYDKVFDSLEVGYLMGYDKNADGYWVNKNGEVIGGVNKAIADADVGEVLDKKGDMRQMVLAVFRDVTLEELLASMGAKNVPSAVQALYNVTVGDILDGESEDATENILNALSDAFGDSTLGEIIGKTSTDPLVRGLLNIQVGRLCKKNLDSEAVTSVLQNAIGYICVGDLLGYKKDANGKWDCDDKLLNVLLDFSFNNIFNLMQAGEDDEAVAKALLGETTIGDIFGIAYGYEYDEAADNWVRRKTTADGVSEEWVDPTFGHFLSVKLWQLFESGDPNCSYELYPDVKDITVGAAAYSMLQALEHLPKSLIKIDDPADFLFIDSDKGGYAYTDDDLRQLSEIVLQIDVEELREHYKDRAYWKEKLRPVESKTALGLFLTKEQENKNAFVKAALKVTFGDLLDLMDDRSDKAISDFITERFTSVELNGVPTTVMVGDLLKLYKSDYAKKTALKTIGDIEFAPFVRAVLGTESRRKVFGHIAMKDLVIDYVPKGRLTDSEVVMATLDITIGEIADLRSNPSLSYLFHNVLEPHYDGITLEQAVDDFWKGYPKHEAVLELLSLELDDFMHAVHTKSFKPIAQKIKDCYDVLDKKEKVVFLGAAAVGAAGLYVFDDPLLVKLAEQTVGDHVWGDYLAKRLGFVLDGEDWKVGGVYNDLADKLFKQKIVYTLDRTKCSIKNEYIKVANLGNLFAVHSKLVDYANKVTEKLHLGRLASDEGGIYVDGVYAGLSRRVLDVRPYEVYRHRHEPVEYFKELFGTVRVGDFAAPVARKVLKKFKFDYSYTVGKDGSYDVHGSFVNGSELVFNITLTDMYKLLKTPSGIKEYLGKLNIGDFMADASNFVAEHISRANYYGKSTLTEDGKGWIVTGNYAYVLNLLYNTNVRELLSGLRNGVRSYIAAPEHFGTVRFGHFFDRGTNYFDEATLTWFRADDTPYIFNTADAMLRRRLFNLSVAEVASPNFNMLDVLSDVYIGEFLDYVCSESGDPFHKHTDDCVWYEHLTVLVSGQEELGPQDRLVRVEGINGAIAQISIARVLREGMSVAMLFKENKLGDIMGLRQGKESVDENGETVYDWHYFYKSEQGYFVIDEEGKKIGETASCDKLVQTLANLDAKILIDDHAAQKITEVIERLRLGYVLEYEYNTSDPANPYWEKNGKRIDGLMQKLAGYTIKQISENLDDITNTWTLGDLMGESVNNNKLTAMLKNSTITSCATDLNAIYVGAAMGYYRSGNVWYTDEACTTPVTDEILLVLCDYQIGHLTGDFSIPGKSFSEDIVDRILNSVSVGTIFKDAGKPEAGGFMALLDPAWKLDGLADNLMNKIKFNTSIDDLINLGVFGDFLVAEDGANNFTAAGSDSEGKRTNYGLLDDLFGAREGLTDQAEIRAYWLELSMPDFMAAMMDTVGSYTRWFEEHADVLRAAGIELPKVS